MKYLFLAIMLATVAACSSPSTSGFVPTVNSNSKGHLLSKGHLI
jgi:hypothetical protein